MVVADLDQVEVFSDGGVQPKHECNPEQLAILQTMVDKVDNSVTKTSVVG